MRFSEIKPGERLKPYVKCFYIYESDIETAFEDTVFPSGSMEIIFNLGSGHWQTAGEDGSYEQTPPIEMWGQIIRPLGVRSVGRNTMLGIRIYPHAAGYFVADAVGLFNNQVIDFGGLAGPGVRSLHARLLETGDWDQRIGLVETYLTGRLCLSEGRLGKMAVVRGVMGELRQSDFFDNIENVASRYGMTSRYLQKIFLQYTGLTPKLYSKINRFQQSLRLMGRKEMSLTSIAYDCGYFDQSHFIREFKSFTGYTPSGYSFDNSPVTLALAGD